jgi:hypothetical protein
MRLDEIAIKEQIAAAGPVEAAKPSTTNAEPPNSAPETP